MAGEAKRRRRAMWVTKAMLLGYTFQQTSFPTVGSQAGRIFNVDRYVAYDPNGVVLREPPKQRITRSLTGPMFFPTQWQAAKYVLKRLGVDLDENTSSS